jgi:hypothetical protein
MPVPFKISITKEILEQSKYCRSDENDLVVIGKNCAIAVALNGMFPDVLVSGQCIYPLGINKGTGNDHKIDLPKIAMDFIKIFDSLSVVPRLRTMLPEFEFTIDIPDEIISQINIDELAMNKPVLSKCRNKMAVRL